MNPFRKRFVSLLEAELPGPTPALGNAPAGDPNQQPAPELTNDASLQASLDATAEAGAAAAGNNPIQKVPEYQQQLQQISQLIKGMIDEIKGTAGEPGTADIWKDMSSSLAKMLSLAGTIDGNLNSLPARLAVKQQQINKQKA